MFADISDEKDDLGHGQGRGTEGVRAKRERGVYSTTRSMNVSTGSTIYEYYEGSAKGDGCVAACVRATLCTMYYSSVREWEDGWIGEQINNNNNIFSRRTYIL